MNFSRIVDILWNGYHGGILFVYVLLVYGILVMLGAMIIHLINCARYKGTEMNGFVRVRVTLNEWPENPPENAPPRMDYGAILINMHDPATIQALRLDPQLSWKQKAECREYEVLRLLERYSKTMDNSSLHDDPGVVLLRQMLEGNHCTGMGRIRRLNAKKGLEIRASSEKKRDKESNNRLMVYKQIPEILCQEYYASTECEVRNLCVTLEYLAQG